jgi:hypothetical protein
MIARLTLRIAAALLAAQGLVAGDALAGILPEIRPEMAEETALPNGPDGIDTHAMVAHVAEHPDAVAALLALESRPVPAATRDHDLPPAAAFALAIEPGLPGMRLHLLAGWWSMFDRIAWESLHHDHGWHRKRGRLHRIDELPSSPKRPDAPRTAVPEPGALSLIAAALCALLLAARLRSPRRART